MSDPLSISASVAGLVSLGLTVVQGLHNYYSSYRDREFNTATTLKKLSHVVSVLTDLESQIKDKCIHDKVDVRDNATIQLYIDDCKVLISELKQTLGRLKETPGGDPMARLKLVGRKLAYPFRQSTLLKLEEDIDGLISSLSLAMQTIQQRTTQQLKENMVDVKKNLAVIRAHQISSTIKGWLKAPDATINFNEQTLKRHPRTGVWFTESQDFKDWLNNPGCLLWVVGSAGVGKSVLTSTAIEYTLRFPQRDPSIGVAFFYITFSDQSKLNASDLMRALILQLSAQTSQGPTIISQLHDAHEPGTPPNSALLNTLYDLIEEFSKVYITIDALDESSKETSRQDLLGCLSSLYTWSKSGRQNVQLLVSSRDEIDIGDHLHQLSPIVVRMRNKAIDNDIKLFVHEQLRNQYQFRRWTEYHPRIESELTRKADGMQVFFLSSRIIGTNLVGRFRWVDCQLKQLVHCPPSDDLLDKLLDSLPSTLDETYARMLGNISSMWRDYARQALVLLCYVKTPLDVSQLIDYIAVEVGEKSFYNPKRRLQDAEAIMQICPGLIEFGESRPREINGRLAHFSVREFLVSPRIREYREAAYFSIDEVEANEIIASIFLAIAQDISFQTSFSSPSSSRLSRGLLRILRRDQHTSMHDALSQWPGHYRASSRKGNLTAQVIRFLIDKNTIGMISYAEGWVSYNPFSQSPGGSPNILLCMAAWYNIDNIISLFGSEDAIESLVSQAEFDRASLEARELLSWKGFTATAHPELYRIALTIASDHKCFDSVQSILQKGAEAEYLALRNVSELGDRELLSSLIKHKPNFGPDIVSNAIWAAARNRFQDIACLLFAAFGGCLVGDDEKQAHQDILEEGYEGIMRILSLERPTTNSRVLLQRAIQNGQVDQVRNILEQGPSANLDGTGGDSEFALEVAIMQGSEEICKLLLKRGVNTARPDHLGCTPLLRAITHGRESIVKLLIDSGAGIGKPELQLHKRLDGYVEVEIQGVRGRLKSSTSKKLLQTTGFMAINKGNIFRILVAAEADHGIYVLPLRPALHVSSGFGHHRITQLLLDHGADMNEIDQYGHTALVAAVLYNQDEVVKTLLAANADVDISTGVLGTARETAVKMKFDRILNLLDEHRCEG